MIGNLRKLHSKEENVIACNMSKQKHKIDGYD